MTNQQSIDSISGAGPASPELPEDPNGSILGVLRRDSAISDCGVVHQFPAGLHRDLAVSLPELVSHNWIHGLPESARARNRGTQADDDADRKRLFQMDVDWPGDPVRVRHDDGCRRFRAV